MAQSKIQRFYLAHPFDSRKYVRAWELKLKKEVNIRILNPFYPKRPWEKYHSRDIACDEYYKQLNVKTLVEEDILAIRKADALIAIIDGALSYGTIQEIVYGYIYKKPISAIVTNKHHNHPWLKYHTNKIFTNFNSFERWAKKNFGEK